MQTHLAPVCEEMSFTGPMELLREEKGSTAQIKANVMAALNAQSISFILSTSSIIFTSCGKHYLLFLRDLTHLVNHFCETHFYQLFH